MGPLIGSRARPVPHGASGFTLVEMLVVLVVLSIAAALLAVGLDRDPRRTLASEAARLAGALEHAAALAQWTGETMGVSAAGSSYRFWRRSSDGLWTGVNDDDILSPRSLPDELRITVASYAGAAVAPDAILPLRSSGRNEPYTLVMASDARSTVLTSDALNRVAVAIVDVAPVPP